MGIEQQTLFSGFKSAKEGLQDAILGDIPPIPNPISIQIKEGVIFKELKPEIYSIFSIVSSVFHEFGKECVITSAHDGVHKGHKEYLEGSRALGVVSRHYLDQAIDLRSKHLFDSMQKHFLWNSLIEKLGSKYRVLFENEGKDNEHFHVQYIG